MSQTKHRNTKADADAHKKALQHVMTQRPHWSVPKITAFCKTCKNLPELIDFNIKIEDAYQNFWKNDMRTVVRFAKRFIELLKWITTEDHRQVIVLNFAYYDFALIQKIYTRFYHIESIVKRMQIAMSVIEIFQITPTLSSLNDAQRSHLNKIQQGIYKTWMAFWSDDSSIKFFNISCIDLAATTLSTATYEPNDNEDGSIDDIDDLLFDEKDDQHVAPENDNNSIFTIDENEDLMDDTAAKKEGTSDHKKTDKDKDDFDDEEITEQDQPLRVDSYLPSNDRSGIPIIRTINIGDELNDINKQLVFVSDVIAWLKQQIVRIKPKLSKQQELRINDQDTFNAIIVCLRKLLLDASSITSLCVSTVDQKKVCDQDKDTKDDTQSEDKTKDGNKSAVAAQTNTSSYLRMIIEIVRDLTDECCKSNKLECIHLFKSILTDIASNKLTHDLVKQLLEVFADRISHHQYKLDSTNQRKSKKIEEPSNNNENDEEMESKSNVEDTNNTKGNINNNNNNNNNRRNKVKNKHKYMNGKYIFHIRVLNCDYFVDHKVYGNDIATAYTHYLQQVINQITTILNKRRFHILYVLSSSSYNNQIRHNPSSSVSNPQDSSIQNNDILSSPSTIAHNSSSYSSPKSSSQHSISPVPIDQNLTLQHPPNSPPISTNNDTIPRIQHTSPLKLNKITLKNNDHSIITNSNIDSSSSSMTTISSGDPNNNINDEDYKYGRLMIGVDVKEVIEHSELDLNTVVSIVSDEIVQTIEDGSYRLNIRFYPIYHACKHRYDTDFFYHRGLSLRDDINKVITNKKGKNKNNEATNTLMKSVLCLALKKQPTDDIIFKRFRLLKKLKDILIKVHGDDAKYEIFGSMATKLDHNESDLDISIHLPPDNDLSFENLFNINSAITCIDDLTIEVKQHRIQQILRPIYQEIEKIPKVRDAVNGYFFKVKFLEHATVPIVKLEDENTGMQSDISFCLTQSVIKTMLIKKYVSIDWRVKPLVLAIKHWVKIRKLNNTHRGDLNSFGFTVMIINYLQTLNPPILPILYVEDKKKTQNDPDWIKSDKFVNFGIKNKQNIGQLFVGFFQHYHHKFKPDIHAISITNNNRSDKINGFLNKKLCHLQNNHNDILIVLDPLDNTDNIGRRVTQITWNNMQKEFKFAAQITDVQHFGNNNHV